MVQTQLVKVGILGNDGQSAIRRNCPNLDVIGSLKIQVPNMDGARIFILQTLNQPGREVLIERRLIPPAGRIPSFFLGQPRRPNKPECLPL